MLCNGGLIYQQISCVGDNGNNTSSANYRWIYRMWIFLWVHVCSLKVSGNTASLLETVQLRLSFTTPCCCRLISSSFQARCNLSWMNQIAAAVLTFVPPAGNECYSCRFFFFVCFGPHKDRLALLCIKLLPCTVLYMCLCSSHSLLAGTYQSHWHSNAPWCCLLSVRCHTEGTPSTLRGQKNNLSLATTLNHISYGSIKARLANI